MSSSPFKDRGDAAVLHRLVGVAAGYHGNVQFFPQSVGEPLRPIPVRSPVLAVEIQEPQPPKLLLGNSGTWHTRHRKVGRNPLSPGIVEQIHVG